MVFANRGGAGVDETSTHAQNPRGYRAAMCEIEASRELCVFSPEGSHLAVSRLDGEVKVWEVTSGRLKLRFSPGGARARPARCLSWSRQSEVVRVMLE